MHHICTSQLFVNKMLPPISYHISGSKIKPELSIHQTSQLEEPLRQGYAKKSE